MQVVFAIVYLAVAFTDLAVSRLARRNDNRAGKTLANCMLSAAFVSAAYVTSILAINYTIATFANVLCFCLIDIMLLCLLSFIYALIFGGLRANKTAFKSLCIFAPLAAIDIASLLLNPLTGHVATYVFLSANIAPHYLFIPHIGYFAHLAVCYLIILTGIGVVAYHLFVVPRIYRGPIVRMAGGVLCLVAFNAVYLAFFSRSGADLTILAYSVLGYYMYLCVFVNGGRTALERTAKSIVDSSGQPTVVFDYKGNLFLANNAAKQLFVQLATTDAGKPPTFEQFIESLGLHDMPGANHGRRRFYWTPPEAVAYSYICDYQETIDEKGKRIAQSLVFTNNALNVDQLTGFLTDQYFIAHEGELATFDVGPVVVAVCDLNQLNLINNAIGYNRGDEAIMLQAGAMRAHLPGKTLFVRLRDAKLAALCYGVEESTIKSALEAANDELAAHTDFNMRLKMDFAICRLEEGEALSATAQRANSILKTKKLLDEESDHSNTIESLRRMLAECDGETEGHVLRTRILGDSLAFELGLSDYERDQLSLLCLFHDIGKVGIPLHILNKPGPLTKSERAIMQEHVQKGYRIARATVGLEIVAEPILHHHENWDGSGYPDGLQHESIPILSRIISVVDSYDAMISDRPYRKGISSQAACEELLRCSNTQFDPYIVDAFVRMMGKQEMVDEVKAISDDEPHPQDVYNATSYGTGTIPPSKTSMLSAVHFSQYHLAPNGRITATDKMFETLTGYTEYDIESMGLTQDALLFDDDRAEYWKNVRAGGSNSGVAFLEHRIKCKDGTGRYVYSIALAPSRGAAVDSSRDGGKDAKAYSGEGNFSAPAKVVIADITDSLSLKHQVNIARNRAIMSLRRLEESIQLDPMTGLLNKAAFRKDCERELLNTSQRCALIMLDLDDFKGYNDTYGHPKGDELLINFADAIAEAAGERAIVGRMGGDEFYCLLSFDVGASIDEANKGIGVFWDRLRQRMEQIDPGVAFSTGAAWASPREMDFDALYERADRNLYQAKREGKERLCIDGNASCIEG